MKSDVYFIELNSPQVGQRCLALERLLEKAVPDPWQYQKEEIVPVKLTLGDSSCAYNISPDIVKVVVNKIKKQGAKPFLFDTSVIYKGKRQNAVDHLSLAQNKGFGYAKTGAPFIIADGLLGQDGREFKTDLENIKRMKIPSFIGMLDSLLVLTHATGHIVSRYAGAIKNVAMGMSCRSTKQLQHSSLKPHVLVKNCTACGCCIEICPVNAISFRGKKALISQDLCIGCAECLCACKFDAIFINWHEDPNIFCKRMVEVAGFILDRFKNKFFLNFAFDITKECDCISTKNDTMISGNIGILASCDILSIDKATMDLANNASRSHFLKEAKVVYEAMFEYAANEGLGNLEYNLVKI